MKYEAERQNRRAKNVQIDEQAIRTWLTELDIYGQPETVRIISVHCLISISYQVIEL